MKEGKKNHVLFIAFTELDKTAQNGAEVRPQKMYDAFLKQGYKVKRLDGYNNQWLKRNKNTIKIFKWLKRQTPDFCYIESPSGPFFSIADLYLLIKLKKKKIPVGLFYRDAFWKFPKISYGQAKSFGDSIKYSLIALLQRIDWRIFCFTCDTIFFPSKTMSDLFLFQKKRFLPPACCETNFIEPDGDLLKRKKILTFIYVGGATQRYGTSFLLNLFQKLNCEKKTANLIFVAPKQDWREYIKKNEFAFKSCGWLMVAHASGDEALRNLYQKADLAIIPIEKNQYNDFAIPIKLFEAVSYGKPIVTTDLKETSKFVLGNKIGWVMDYDSPKSLEQIKNILMNRNQIYNYSKNCKITMKKNTWEKRVEYIMKTLQGE